MNRLLASSVGLATTALLVGACGAGKPTTNYSPAAANATETPTNMETSPYPEGSPTGTETSMTPTGTMSPSPEASPTGTETGMVPIPTPQHAQVKVADSKYGKILVGDNDRTLYLFEKDKENTSYCYDTCAVTWPPLLTRDKPQAGTGVKEHLLGTTTRKQGEKQVTYNKHPLYYYRGDKKPGEFNGQGKNEFGGKWYVVNPEGKKVE
jgi:predicted lipoprotein with Yx(FWY)xxD motif